MAKKSGIFNCSQNLINVNNVAIHGLLFSVRDVEREESVQMSGSDLDNESDPGSSESDNSQGYIREIVDFLLSSDTDTDSSGYCFSS